MTIDYAVADAVATITLNRPDAMNALSLAMKRELLAALERARDDARVRAVLLTGSGRAFCAGQDLREHAGGTLDGGPADAERRHGPGALQPDRRGWSPAWASRWWPR